MARVDGRTSVASLGVVAAALTTAVSVPRLACSRAQIASLPIEPRFRFLLARIDGRTALDDILDACGVPEDVALALLRRLVSLGVVTFGPPDV